MNQPSAKPMHSLPAPIEPFTLDCDHLLTHAGGDPELLVQLCVSFLHELPLRVESAHAALIARNYLAFQRSLQQLRTCLVVFGSAQLSFIVSDLERAARERRIRQAQREWKRLESQLQLLVSQVQRLVLEMPLSHSAVQ